MADHDQSVPKYTLADYASCRTLRAPMQAANSNGCSFHRCSATIERINWSDSGIMITRIKGDILMILSKKKGTFHRQFTNDPSSHQ